MSNPRLTARKLKGQPTVHDRDRAAELLLRNGWSQVRIAELFGVTVSSIDNWTRKVRNEREDSQEGR